MHVLLSAREDHEAVFFFQAEDGIRDYKVTGVQTCALPICGARFQREHFGQITQRRPFHSSNASRRPTPSPEGPPSPSSVPLQKAQVRYITDRKSTRLNSSHLVISYAVFCLKKKNNKTNWSSSTTTRPVD